MPADPILPWLYFISYLISPMEASPRSRQIAFDLATF